MDHDTTIIEPTAEDPWSEVPESVRPPRRYPKWPFILAGVLLIIGTAIAALWPVKVPYYTLSPGPVYDTSDYVSVSEGTTNASGELFFLTVSLKEANLFEYLTGYLDPSVNIAPRENIRPPGVSQDQLRREALASMDQSKTDATFVALTELGYDVTLIGTGAEVIETVPGSAADGVLQAGDVIVELNGERIEFRSDVLDLLQGSAVGDEVTLVVERSVEETDQSEAGTDEDQPAESETIELTLVLGPHTDDPERPMIGVLLDNHDPIIEFPVDVTIDSQNIGGPSAGMMFTLQIMNQLTEDDITAGLRIAGTGTIARDGTVGPIGGIQQKVFGAIDAGADVVFVPADNYDAALSAAGDDIDVVRVETIDDPLEYLEAVT
jgi:PDZ domain-containing protein